MDHKEEDNIYTWKIRRQKPITNYTKYVRHNNSDRVFIQIKFHETDTKNSENEIKYNDGDRFQSPKRRVFF
jgi:hypothetical protein